MSVRVNYTWICDEPDCANTKGIEYSYRPGEDLMRVIVAPLGWREAAGRIFCERHIVSLHLRVQSYGAVREEQIV